MATENDDDDDDEKDNDAENDDDDDDEMRNDAANRCFSIDEDSLHVQRLLQCTNLPLVRRIKGYHLYAFLDFASMVGPNCFWKSPTARMSSIFWKIPGGSESSSATGVVCDADSPVPPPCISRDCRSTKVAVQLALRFRPCISASIADQYPDGISNWAAAA